MTPDPADALSLLCEAQELEERARERRDAAGLLLVALKDGGMTLEEIGARVGLTRERVRQLVKVHRPRVEPDLGPGEADLALHRQEVARRAGQLSGVSRRHRAETRARLDAAGVEPGCRADALRFLARAGSDELRPLGVDEALTVWLELQRERRSA